MKKKLLLAIGVMCFLFLSCQKAQPPEEIKSGTQSSQQTPTAPEVKREEKEKPIETKSSVLTEKEQKTFRGVFGQEGMSEKEALQDIRVLSKGTPGTIPYYQDPDFGDEQGRLDKYTDDFSTVIKRLANLRSKEGYGLILEILETKGKPEYFKGKPSSIKACAAEAIGWYGELKKGKWHGDKRAIPVLKEIINDKDPEVRLQAAGSLLGLGEGDIALPILDTLAKAGIQQSTFALDKLFTPEEMEEDGRKEIVVSHIKLWDSRGKEILVKALNYSSDEVKAFAAARLVDMGEKGLAEPVLLDILERLKDMKLKNYGLTKDEYRKYGGGGKEEAYKKYNSDWRALYTAISRLGKLKNRKAIIVLKDVIANGELGSNDSLIGDEARKALKSIEN